MNRKRFWVAVPEAGPLRADWFCGGLDEARQRWPSAAEYVDATDMTDDEFERLVIEHEAANARRS